MAKVKTKYRIDTGDYYKPVKYKQHTFDCELPKDEYGFIKVLTLAENLRVMLTHLEPCAGKITILHHQIVE